MAVALLLLTGQHFRDAGSRDMILEVVAANGQRFRTPVSSLPAGEGSSWHIAGPGGGIKLSYWPGKGVPVEEASCPDQVCVNMGFIDQAGQSIVCVPNQMIIRLFAAGEPDEGEEELDGILK
jgi:hypothetical protein